MKCFNIFVVVVVAKRLFCWDMVHVYKQTLTRHIMVQLQMHKPFIRTHLRINQPSYQMSDIVNGPEKSNKKNWLLFLVFYYYLFCFFYILLRSELNILWSSPKYVDVTPKSFQTNYLTMFNFLMLVVVVVCLIW